MPSTSDATALPLPAGGAANWPGRDRPQAGAGAGARGEGGGEGGGEPVSLYQLPSGACFHSPSAGRCQLLCQPLSVSDILAADATSATVVGRQASALDTGPTRLACSTGTLGTMTAVPRAIAPYAPSAGVYDEALRPDGSLREPGGAGLVALGDRDPVRLRDALRARLGDAGVGFTSAGGDAEFNLDPVPRVLGAREFAGLEAGLAQRVRALNAFVADVYGPRTAVADGVVPGRVVETAEGFEPGMVGANPPGGLWVGIAGLDLVRSEQGEWLVLEDNLMTPSGFAYAIAARTAVLEALAPETPPLPLEATPGMLAATLRSAAPDPGEPAIVVLTDGEGNSAAWEHAWAARALGVPLVEPGDLELRGDRLRHRGEPVDVVYRRTDQDRLDTPVGALLGPPLRAGTLAVVNAFGTGVGDDKAVHAYTGALIEHFLGERPLLRGVETLDLGEPEQLERALDELERLVIKPRHSQGGVGVLVAAHAEPEDVERTREEVRRDPGGYVAQPLISLSVAPTVAGDGIHPRHVDLRPFVFLRADGAAQVMPGGLTRVAFDEGALVVNSTQNGGAKDTWVLP
jgi:uncharacterized circularly permuted ATP-grasp superfamily protein